ncbi:hypothetical protein QE424_001615 [Stenotrophomonas rhizophila]|uniref:Uncharacterized protein n=1 Tax=Stenotrophomonas rhizophila TaxID=216778 RepID=A0AAP5AHY9_9GAMM|nr:hypothetical protein [Stenotrophomonas rhizophila]
MAGLPAAATAVSRRIPGPARIRDQLRDRDPARAHTRVLAPTLAPVLARVLDRIPALGQGLDLDLDLDLVPARVPAPILDLGHTPGPARIRLRHRTGTTRSGMPPPSPPEWR